MTAVSKMVTVLAGAAIIGGVFAAPAVAVTFVNATPYQCFDAGQPGGTTNLGSIADSSVGATQHQLGAFTGTCTNQSPFKDVPNTPGATWYFVEDFEDGFLNTPGLSANRGGVINTPSGFVDSVDADDGNIDGFSAVGGRTWFINRGTDGVTFTFDKTNAALNGLFPTHAGLVWTDGNIAEVIFTAFDPFGGLLGSVSSILGDSNFASGTAEDRFFGVINAGGIGSINIIATTGRNGLEVDHVQFGRLVEAPEPGALALFGVGLLGLGFAARRRKAVA